MKEKDRDQTKCRNEPQKHEDDLDGLAIMIYGMNFEKEKGVSEAPSDCCK